MNIKMISAATILALGTGYAAMAFSQVRPDVLVKQRQSAMVLQGKYFYGHLRPTAQGKIPYDAAAVARNAAFLDALSKMPWGGFVSSTREIKSATAAAAYTDAAKFQQSQKAFEGEVAKLVALTKGGAEEAVKAQILAIDKACSACHQDFRERQ